MIRNMNQLLLKQHDLPLNIGIQCAQNKFGLNLLGQNPVNVLYWSGIGDTIVTVSFLCVVNLKMNKCDNFGLIHCVSREKIVGKNNCMFSY